MQEERRKRNVGAMIESRRKSLGLSKMGLARLAAVEPAVVTRTEAGQTLPQPESLEALALALQMPLTDLYEAAGYPVPKLPPIRAYLRRSFHLSETEISDIELHLRQQGARFGGASLPSEHEDELPE